ncbi:MAG: hypothetical protein ACREF9_09220, partial [Opitutaceae bacterium]
MNPLAKVADQCREILAAQTVGADGPGTILRDVESLIDFIGERGLATGSRNGNLPTAALQELNVRLGPAVEVELKRTMLRDYPNVAGPFVLLRVMGLAVVEGKRLRIDPKALAAWRDLNPVEKYFALLEAWLFHAETAVLGGEEERRRLTQFSANLRFLANLRFGQWKSFDEDCHRSDLFGAVSTWNTHLQVKFGLIEVKERPLMDRRADLHGWIMAKARRTPWGQAVAWAIIEHIAA